MVKKIDKANRIIKFKFGKKLLKKYKQYPENPKKIACPNETNPVKLTRRYKP